MSKLWNSVLIAPKWYWSMLWPPLPATTRSYRGGEGEDFSRSQVTCLQGDLTEFGFSPESNRSNKYTWGTWNWCWLSELTRSSEVTLTRELSRPSLRACELPPVHPLHWLGSEHGKNSSAFSALNLPTECTRHLPGPREFCHKLLSDDMFAVHEWFSNISIYENHLGGLRECWIPPPECEIQ